MTRKRRNPPPEPAARRSRTAAEPSAVERARRRIDASPEIELSDEELDALADEGIDPEDLRRVARQRTTDADRPVSPHDRDTVRDDLEGLTLEEEE